MNDKDYLLNTTLLQTEQQNGQIVGFGAFYRS